MLTPRFNISNIGIGKKLLLVEAIPLLAIWAQLSISGWNAWRASEYARDIANLAKQAPRQPLGRWNVEGELTLLVDSSTTSQFGPISGAIALVHTLITVSKLGEMASHR